MGFIKLTRYAGGKRTYLDHCSPVRWWDPVYDTCPWFWKRDLHRLFSWSSSHSKCQHYWPLFKTYVSHHIGISSYPPTWSWANIWPSFEISTELQKTTNIVYIKLIRYVSGRSNWSVNFVLLRWKVDMRQMLQKTQNQVYLVTGKIAEILYFLKVQFSIETSRRTDHAHRSACHWAFSYLMCNVEPSPTQASQILTLPFGYQIDGWEGKAWRKGDTAHRFLNE